MNSDYKSKFFTNYTHNLRRKSMKTILIIILGLSSTILCSQEFTYVEEIKLFQVELNKEFKNPDKSPLSKRKQKKFKEHDFYPINEAFHVKAKFIRTQNSAPFKMKTTTERAPTYEKYGDAFFEIKNKKYKLSIYQSHSLRKTKKYKNHLFLPFTDLTNGEETYGGGRYIDLNIPDTESLTIDFNKAYNPILRL